MLILICYEKKKYFSFTEKTWLISCNKEVALLERGTKIQNDYFARKNSVGSLTRGRKASVLLCWGDELISLLALFSFLKNLQKVSDSPLHRILRYMH